MLTPWMDVERTFNDLDAWRRRMDQLFYDRPAGSLLSSAAFDASPRTSFRDKGEALSLTFELPGFTQADVKVEVTRELLTVSGERKMEVPKAYVPQRQERSGLRFSRSFALPVPVDAEAATATVKEGVLTITLPKLPEVRPRKIEVRAFTPPIAQDH